MPTAFPDVIACFALLLTLSVASATAERSFCHATCEFTSESVSG